MSNIAKDKIVQNIKLLKIMKSCGYPDIQIAEALGVSVKELIDTVGEDDYIKGIYEAAQESLVTDIEKKFVENVLSALESGKNEDAKWLLERLSPKYAKKDQLDVNVRGIDEIIRER